MKELESQQTEIVIWSKDTFGNAPDRKLALAKHLKEEAEEVRTAVLNHKRNDVKFQLADCLIIMLDLADKFDITANELIEAVTEKMEFNYTRKWYGPDENGLFHHKK